MGFSWERPNDHRVRSPCDRSFCITEMSNQETFSDELTLKILHFFLHRGAKALAQGTSETSE
jgi:hypothetical protein